jgi:hypothetical protein
MHYLVIQCVQRSECQYETLTDARVSILLLNGWLPAAAQVPRDCRFQRTAGPTGGEAVQDELVPADTAWLLGDNASNSIDSRHYGPVPISLITSRVIFRVHPQDEAGPIEQRLPDRLGAAGKIDIPT